MKGLTKTQYNLEGVQNSSIKHDRHTELFSFSQQKREGKQASCQPLNWAELGVLEEVHS